MDVVEDTFDYYANFGSGQWGSEVLDSAKFIKLCRECRLLDRNCTRTEADLVFRKVLPYGERRMPFDYFVAALRYLGAVRFKHDPPDIQLSKIVDVICENAPPSSECVGLEQNLSDRERWGAGGSRSNTSSGGGRGGYGGYRAPMPQPMESGSPTTSSLGSISRFDMPIHPTGSTTGYGEPNYQRQGRQGYGNSSPTRSQRSSYSAGGDSTYTSVRSPSRTREYTHTHHNDLVGAVVPERSEVWDEEETERLASYTRTSQSGARTGGIMGPRRSRSRSRDTRRGPNHTTVPNTDDGVYKRLTDHRYYTGSHRHRFDRNGVGKGSMGRDTVAVGPGTHSIYAGGDVTDLSVICRPHLH